MAGISPGFTGITIMFADKAGKREVSVLGKMFRKMNKKKRELEQLPELTVAGKQYKQDQK